jgi:hypothetical protein
MTAIFQALAMCQEQLKILDEALCEQEEKARQAQKANRLSRKIATRKRELRNAKARPKRARMPKIYGRQRARLAIEAERLILALLEKRNDQIAQKGFTTILENIRAQRFGPPQTERSRSDARQRAESAALRDIVDEICDRLLARFGEKAAREDNHQDWSETALRAVLRQRMALLKAGLQGLGRDDVAQELRDQDLGSLALYERLYYSTRFQSQKTFNDFVNFLGNDVPVVPSTCGAIAYRRGWQEGLAECMRAAAAC